MTAYLTLIIWCLVTSYLYEHSKKDNNSFGIFRGLPFIGLFTVSAIRYNVGSDYKGTYTNAYLRVLAGLPSGVDLLPTMIYKVMATLELDLQWFFVVTSFIVCWFMYISINKLSSDKTLSYYILICGCYLFFSYNGVRQAISMALFYYSLNYLDETKNNFQYVRRQKKHSIRMPKLKDIHFSNKVKYVIVNLAGVGFHLAAIIFLPLVATLKRQLKLKTKLAIIVVSIIVSNYGIPTISSLIGRTRFLYYLENASRFSQESLNLSMYINILFLILYECLYFKCRIVSEKDVIYGNIHFYGLVITVFVTHIPLMYRVFYSFRYIEIFSIPNLVKRLKTKYKNIVLIGIYGIYFVYFILMIGVFNGHEVLPYLTIFVRRGNL